MTATTYAPPPSSPYPYQETKKTTAKKAAPKKSAAKRRIAKPKAPPKAAKSVGKRGEEHMSVRVVTADKRRFIALCKERECPQSEMFRRFVAALGRAGKKTRVVTIRITGYSPV